MQSIWRQRLRETPLAYWTVMKKPPAKNHDAVIAAVGMELDGSKNLPNSGNSYDSLGLCDLRGADDAWAAWFLGFG